jgi:predicted GNAT family acetyltransferase
MLPKIALSPVVHDAHKKQFEIQADGYVAFAHYIQEGDLTIFDHTYVPEVFRGSGIAATIVRAALDEARKLQWKIVPRCSFVAAFIERNPDFADLVAKPTS